MDIQILRQYLSLVLLAVFAWVNIPAHTLHDIFADHEDTDIGYCAAYHAHLGLHVEKKHSHCGILKTDAPVYDRPSFHPVQKAQSLLIALIDTPLQNTHCSPFKNSLPARGPPAV